LHRVLYKLYALRLNHIQDIIVNRNVKFINFSVYWIGYQLRDLNFNLASLSVPLSDLVSPFYGKLMPLNKANIQLILTGVN
jgi:hypothetical protein